MPLLSRFMGLFSIPLNRQSDPSSHFFGVSVCLIDAQYLLNLYRSFCCRYLLDTQIELHFLYIYIYIFEVQSSFAPNQISRSLSLLSQSKPFLFTKNLLPLKISAYSKPQSLGKCSKTFFFSSIFMNFVTQVLVFEFYENFWVRFC